MNQQRIVYYQCGNEACGLRFPELRDGLERECCPMCKQRIYPTQVIDPPEREAIRLNQAATTLQLEGLLDNIRSGLNVGGIFRSADGIGLRKLYLGGITPTPENIGVKKTALRAEKSVAWEWVNNGVEKVKELKKVGYCVWGLETADNAVSLYSIDTEIPSQPLVLVAGNEVFGIDPQMIALCDLVVSIPMVGRKQSLNVAIAFGIAASYIRYRQISSQESESKLPNRRLIP